MADAAELRRLNLGALKKRARQAGVDMSEVERAVDEEDEPKAAVISLILAAEAARAATTRGLAGLKLGALKARAREAGVDMVKVDAVIDEADDPKGAVVELIVASSAGGIMIPEGVPTRSGTTATQPDLRARTAPASAPAPVRAPAWSCPA